MIFIDFIDFVWNLLKFYGFCQNQFNLTNSMLQSWFVSQTVVGSSEWCLVCSKYRCGRSHRCSCLCQRCYCALFSRISRANCNKCGGARAPDDFYLVLGKKFGLSLIGCGLWLATVIRHSFWMTVTHIRGRSCTGIGGVKLTIQLYFALINLLTFMFPQP